MTLPNVVFKIPSDVIRLTQAHLRTHGKTREEGVVLWRGTFDPPRITGAIIPLQETAVGRFRVPLAERQRIARELSGTGELIVAQVHSHPRDAFHSPIDDEEAIPRRVGAYSLVVPAFASSDSLFDEAALFQLDADGRWRPAPLDTFHQAKPQGAVKWLIEAMKNFARSRT